MMNQITTLYHLIFVVKIKIIMKVCILGDGLIALSIAKALINQEIYVDIFSYNNKKKLNQTRTIGISDSNIEFYNKNICNIEKFLWNISEIDIYNEKLKNEKLLNFHTENKRLFSIIRNNQLHNYLLSILKKEKFLEIKKKINYNKIAKDYGLIINCDLNNYLTKKYFYKKINKNYNSLAYTTIIKHQKITNNVATQIFTKKGPIAFLPLSENETSIVYSVKGKENINLRDLIEIYNPKYKISGMKNFSFFELKSSNLRSYHHKNILAFGDLLHRLHPLAGQGFNMSVRDIKKLIQIIKYKINLGLDLDYSICLDFEKKMKHKNYIFSSGVDFIYEFFNFENKIDNKIMSKSIKYFGKKKFTNKILTNIANRGLIF